MEAENLPSLCVASSALNVVDIQWNDNNASGVTRPASILTCLISDQKSPATRCSETDCYNGFNPFSQLCLTY
jgi:hypothetical protein